MLELNFTPFPVLTTNRLLMRQADPIDVHEVFFLRSDAQIMRHIRKDPEQSLEDSLKWINMVVQAAENNIFISWNITVRGTNKTIGIIALWRIVKEHYRAELGYVLHPDFQNKGIMNEALQVVLEYGFNTLKLHSIEARINPANSASIKLLERNNFIREAYFRENYYFNGIFSDTAVYSLSSAEYCTGIREVAERKSIV